MNSQLPSFGRSDKEWSELSAAMAVDELIAGKLLVPAQADFAHRIIAQQLLILLISNCRPHEEVQTDPPLRIGAVSAILPV